jgi:hypothetical protein
VALVAAFQVGHLQADGLTVDHRLGVIQADLVLGFRFHLFSPVEGLLDFGLVYFGSVVGFVDKHA